GLEFRRVLFRSILSMGSRRLTVVCRSAQLYGSTDPIYFKTIDSDGYRGVGKRSCFRKPHGRISVDLWFCKSCSWYSSRQTQPKVAYRRQPVRLVCRHFSDGICDEL